MLNNLGLSFGLLIALFIPGFVILVVVALQLYCASIPNTMQINEILTSLKDSPSLFILVGSLASLIFGLLLDSIRYIFTWLVQYFLASKIDISIFKDEDMKYHDWVIEQSFRFHQFYANLFLSLLIASVFLWNLASLHILFLLYFSCAICLMAAVLSYEKTHRSLVDRVNLIRKEG